MKKLLLLTITSLFIFHIQLVSAQDTSSTTSSSTTNEECVIKDDPNK